MVPPTHENLVATMQAGTNEVFSTMLGLELIPCEAYLNRGDPSREDGVLSFVALAGAWAGTGNISCSAGFARKIAAALLSTEFQSVNDEVLDAVGEVTNMIIGCVKTSLEEQIGAMGLSIPTVIHGRNFTSRSGGTQQWTVVPFECAGERFTVQMFLARQSHSASFAP